MTNTYQGILITNGEQSYAVFTYQCGLMAWSGGATVGFTSAGEFYQNHRLSGTPSITNIACLNPLDSEWTNIVYQLSKNINNCLNYIHMISYIYTGDNHLPFLELGSTDGVAKEYLPMAVNASSPAVNIPGGFTIGTDIQTSVYVSDRWSPQPQLDECN